MPRKVVTPLAVAPRTGPSHVGTMGRARASSWTFPADACAATAVRPASAAAVNDRTAWVRLRFRVIFVSVVLITQVPLPMCACSQWGSCRPGSMRCKRFKIFRNRPRRESEESAIHPCLAVNGSGSSLPLVASRRGGGEPAEHLREVGLIRESERQCHVDHRHG